MAAPLISICIPAYNRADLIGATVASALAQTYTNLELVITDNCSTDNTWSLLQDLAQQDARIRIFKNEENLGAVRNWQRALALAQGEYAMLLWSDDLIKPAFIEKCFAAFEPDAAFVMSGIEEFSAEGVYYTNTFGAQQKMPSFQYWKEILFQNKQKFPVSPACALFRTEELRGAVLNTLPNADNIDFNRTGAGPDLLTFLINSARYPFMKIVPEVLASFRSHSGSITVVASAQAGLKLHYDWARYFFIKNYREDLLPAYKAVTVLRNYRFKKLHQNLLREMKNVQPNFLFVAKLMMGL